MKLENVEDVYPLSPTQAGMLFHTASAPHSGVYVGQIQCMLSGNLKLETFQAAWQDVIGRHSALRTAFLWDGLEEPLQVVRQRVDLDWKMLDWSEIAPLERAVRLEKLLLADRRAGFELSDAPLMRMLLVRSNDSRHRLVWSCHHLLMDGWSASIVLDEVFQCYAARIGGRHCTLPAVAPYSDYIAWLRARKPEASAVFWRDYLKGFSSRTSLQTAPTPGDADQKPLHRVLQARIPAATTVSLLESARKRRITLNTLLHGAWSVLLARYSDTSDVVFGTTVSGRPASFPRVERSVGLFINTLPVRVRVDETRLTGEWLVSLQEKLLQLRECEHTPLVRIQEYSELPRGEALFDTLLVLENYPLKEASTEDGSGLELVDVQSLDQSNYPLAVLVVPAEELRLTLVYAPSVYAEQTVAGICEHLQTLLSATPSCLDLPIRKLPMLSDAVERQLLRAWNETAEVLPGEITVLDLISEQVTRGQASVALAFADHQLSYRELGVASDRLARCLVSSGIQSGDRVAICLERGLDLITGILAILKAGGVYVPLDPNYPAARLEYMIRDSGALLVLSRSQLTSRLPESVARQVLLDNELPAPGDDATRQLLPDIEPEQPAYLIYTSGSTGRPKGVLVSHRNLLNSTLARHSYYQDGPSIFLLLSSVTFDSSVAGIFWALTTGARLVVSEYRIEQDIARLAACIEQQGVTHTLCLPSLYGLLLEHAATERLQSLRTVIVAGEAVPARLLQLQRARLPGVALYNEYGPTEGTVWCSVYDTRTHDQGTQVPIGKPVANARIFILDSTQRLVPPGVAGEIYVGGEGVTQGYWNMPEVSAQKFVTLNLGGVEERLYRSGDLARYLPDGNIIFLGRVDRQIKLRGFRIEPTEIESVLLQHPDILEAVVLSVKQTSTSASQLTAFLATAPSAVRRLQANTDELRGFIGAKLPEYMVPAAFCVLESIPLLPNGKVDIAALGRLGPGMDQVREESVEPRNVLERLLADIWCEVLQLGSVSVHDDFFELGGDSILSIQIVSKANQQGLSLSPNDLFNFPTIAQLEARISARPGDSETEGLPVNVDTTTPAHDSVVQRNAQGVSVVTHDEARRPFIMVHAGSLMVSALRSTPLELDRPVYVLTAAKHWEEADLQPDTTVEQMADQNLAELRSLQPTGPYLLGGYSMGAPIALEIASRLRLAGEKVELLFLLDPPGMPSSRPRPGARTVDTRANRTAETSLRPGDSGKLARYSARLAGISTTDKFSYIADKLKRRARNRLVNRPRAFMRNRVIQPGAARLAAIYRKLGRPVPSQLRNHYVNTVYLEACKRYSFKPYDGPVVIFHASKHPGDKRIWESVTTGDMMVEWFEGSHMDFLRNPELLNRWTLRLVELLLTDYATSSAELPERPLR